MARQRLSKRIGRAPRRQYPIFAAKPPLFPETALHTAPEVYEPEGRLRVGPTRRSALQFERRVRVEHAIGAAAPVPGSAPTVRLWSLGFFTSSGARPWSPALLLHWARAHQHAPSRVGLENNAAEGRWIFRQVGRGGAPDGGQGRPRSPGPLLAGVDEVATHGAAAPVGRGLRTRRGRLCVHAESTAGPEARALPFSRGGGFMRLPRHRLKRPGLME
jgi:hypothetical protein